MILLQRGMPVRVVIADDEPRAREVLRYYLEKVGDVEVVGEAATGSEAVEAARRLAPDAVFLDVRMPDLDGMEAAQLLAGLSPRPKVVFVTAFEDHAVEAFEAEAVDYLVKPITAARVLQSVERLRRRLAEQVGPRSPAGPPPVPIPAAATATPAAPATPSSAALAQRLPIEVLDDRGRRTVLLEVRSLLLIEARGKGSVVRTAKAEFETATSLANWEETLPADLFLRVHRGFLVNLRAIRELFTEGRTTFLRLDGRPEAVPVSRDRLGELRQRLALPN